MFVWAWNVDKSVELKDIIVVRILCEVLISVNCEMVVFVLSVVCVIVVLDDEDVVELKGCMQTEQLYS